MPEKIGNILIKLKFYAFKLTSSPEIKTLIEIADQYYAARSEGKLHEEAILNIIKNEYLAKEDQNYTLNFVYKRKDFIDMTFENQYGKKGKPMAHLLRLSQRIHADRHLDIDKRNDKKSLIDIGYAMKNKFNVVVLNMFNKYNT